MALKGQAQSLPLQLQSGIQTRGWEADAEGELAARPGKMVPVLAEPLLQGKFRQWRCG
ncbi:hypothetical protein D3C86_2202300 [compost metagenome]